ncbi:hypothetical protein ZYGR_0I05150 [Zygosaccharomyces rouxii]|uniref:Beige protein homolog 1 n=1 Tax=Zygosaccharomyces rouxii TaxID=4956 RepID=A0A1Q2ZXX0_ZYGRO|nr:hypothetical protein ZYGR_0I05150 [Zygosaccharomyces rouxii]
MIHLNADWKMADEMEALVNLLGSVLLLNESDQESNANVNDHISDILLNYESPKNDGGIDSESGRTCELDSYVDSELSSRFELSNTDDTFQLEAIDQWEELFSDHWNSVYYAVSLQLIISLANISLLNKMKLSKIKNLKVKILERLKLGGKQDIDSLVKNRLDELCYQILSVDCEPTDLLKLYSHFNQNSNYDILNSLAAQMSDPLAQNYLQLENNYKISRPAPKSLRCSLQFFLEFNNVTSNRISTIGENIYLEIKEGQFCISNDEFIIALFEEFEFEPAILYSLALTINDNEVSLYVDGNYISTITLLEGSITTVDRIDLGSLICSFKLFRFTIYDDVLTGQSLKILFALGSHFKNSFDRDLSIHGLEYALDDAFLEKLSKSISPSGVTVESLSRQTQQLHKQHVLIDLDPSNEYTICTSEGPENSVQIRTIGIEDPAEDLGMGRCYYYKGANLISIFTSINCFRFIFCSLEDCQDMDQLYNFLSHLMILLRSGFLRHWFKKEFGFPLLSHILIMKVIKKLDKSLPIQFLNLFQEYCGWDFSNISNSLIGDEIAYQSLVLNFDLWYHDSSKDEESRAGVEIIRFLFFQISSLLGSSNYRQFNSQKLVSLNVLEKLCYFQHFFSEKHGYPNVFEELKPDLTNVYLVLLKDNLKKSSVQWLLQFSHFEAKSGYFQNTEVAMNAVDQLFTECLSVNDTKAAQVFMESVSPKFLLMVLGEIVSNKGNPRLCLNILFKLLLFSSAVFRNFTKSNGMDLLFDILKDTDMSFYENVICLLYAYSLGSYNTISSLTSFEDFQDNNFVLEMKVVMRDPFYLAVELLEWATINDIRMHNPAALDTLITKFLYRLSLLLKNPQNYAVFDPRVCILFVKLNSLFITLTKPQNSSIYGNSSKLITDIISSNLLHAILTLNTSDFEKYLEAITHSTGSELDKSASELELSANVFEMAFLNNFFVAIFRKLNDLKFPFESQLVKNPFMVSNILLYFNRFKHHILIVKFNTRFYLEILESAVNIVDVLLRNGLNQFENVSKFAAINLITYSVIPLLYPVFNGESSWDAACLVKFCKLLQDHNDALFGKGHGYCEKELVKFILSFLLSQLMDDDHVNTVGNCLRTIISHNWKDLPAIAGSLGVEDGPELNSILMDIALNESKLLKVVRENNLFGDSQRDQAIDYALRRINLGQGINIISEEGLKEKILHCRLFQMDSNYTQREKRHRLFSEDNVALDKRVRIIYRKFYTNFVTDMEQDTVVHNNELFFLTFQHIHTLALQQDTGDACIWELDSVEDFNRMRRRMLPSPRELNDEQFSNSNEEDSKKGEVKPRPRQFRTNSVLSYDIISELETLEMFTNDMKDENRKVLKVLRGKDSIKTVWNCSLVIGLDVREGILIVAQFNVYFISNYYFVNNENKVIKLSEVPESRRDPNINLITGSNNRNNQQNYNHEVHLWLLSDLIFVTKRPFLLRDVAIELLFENGTNCFVSFDSKRYRDAAYSSFEKLPKNKNIDPVLLNILRELNTRSSSIGTKNGISKASLKSKVFKALSSGPRLVDGSEATSQWQKGEISNFYYLIILNTLAGRTFNDLTQYPVFPWVISDYSSEELDLSDPSVYRNLSKPMGAQSKKRELQFIERYEALEALNDENALPFHYGTHYSSAMIVSSYLIRLKPFVNSFLLLQDGNFGHADRLFNSIDRAWSSAAVENTTDVRELTPEFFFLPELFLNMNNYEFGKSQNGNEVNNVVLPPWAKGDPKAFIWKNREALESPYVSEHLHEWIDLIFGFKQRGENAISSVNVFNNLSYPGAVNLDSINDEMERRAVTGIIHNFGQTPLQIFQEPHPPKQCSGVHRINEIIWSNMPERPNSIYPATVRMSTNTGIRYIYWQANPDGSLYWSGYPFLDVMLKISGSFLPVKLVSPCSLQIGSKAYDFIHQSRVTTFTFWRQNEFITGDESGLIKVWNYSNAHSGGKLSLWGTLHGHLAGLKDMRLYPDYNTLISVDELGVVYMWDLIKYRLIRRFSSEGVEIAISQNHGNVAVHTKPHELCIYSFNGLFYTNLTIDSNKCITRLEFLDFSGIDLGLKRHAYWQEKEVLVVGFLDGSLEVYELVLGKSSQWSLKLLKLLKTGENLRITCIKTQLRLHPFDNGGKLPHDVPKLEIMAGDESGNLFVWR